VTLILGLVQLFMKDSVKLLILQARTALVGSQSLKNLLADLTVGYLNVAIPVVKCLVSIGQRDDIPRSLVTLSTTQARTLRSGVIMVNNLWHLFFSRFLLLLLS